VAPVVVCGFLRDKAVVELTHLLAPLAARVICTRPASDRAADPDEVAAGFSSLGVAASTVADPAAAARQARAELGRGGALLGCGSLYLIGTFRQVWGRRTFRPAGGPVGASREVEGR
jgi:dihydrofolate synthase/folylpolyglutamate synthase